jgi:hypothetical protein
VSTEEKIQTFKESYPDLVKLLIGELRNYQTVDEKPAAKPDDAADDAPDDAATQPLKTEFEFDDYRSFFGQKGQEYNGQGFAEVKEFLSRSSNTEGSIKICGDIYGEDLEVWKMFTSDKFNGECAALDGSYVATLRAKTGPEETTLIAIAFVCTKPRKNAFFNFVQEATGKDKLAKLVFICADTRYKNQIGEMSPGTMLLKGIEDKLTTLKLEILYCSQAKLKSAEGKVEGFKEGNTNKIFVWYGKQGFKDLDDKADLVKNSKIFKKEDNVLVLQVGTELERPLYKKISVKASD